MPEEKKKISILTPLDIIRQIEGSGLSQTEAVLKGLELLFSEDYKQIESYKDHIIEYEKQILILKTKLEELTTLKQEISWLHDQIEKQREDYRANMIQIKMRDDIMETKRRWWKIW